MQSVVVSLVPLVFLLAAAFVLFSLFVPDQKAFKAWLARPRTVRPARTPTYRATHLLMSPAERSFYGVLAGICVGQYVAAKVRLADVITPIDTGKAFWPAFGLISQKQLDFVICEASSMAILCCVELDDSSHDRDDRRKRDAFIDEALASAGVPVVHIKARAAYVPGEVRAALAAVARR